MMNLLQIIVEKGNGRSSSYNPDKEKFKMHISVQKSDTEVVIQSITVICCLKGHTRRHIRFKALRRHIRFTDDDDSKDANLSTLILTMILRTNSTLNEDEKLPRTLWRKAGEQEKDKLILIVC